MIREHLIERGISNQRIIDAFESVPREEFVLPGDQMRAYEDNPLPIGHGQTISQPYIIALALEFLNPQPNEHVLEIGAGCGYAAAIVSRMCAQVTAVERIDALATMAKETIERLGYDSIDIINGDGTAWERPDTRFDAVLVSAATRIVPEHIVRQLVVGGKMVIPVGPRSIQRLIGIVKHHDESITSEELCQCRFVPLVKDA